MSQLRNVLSGMPICLSWFQMTIKILVITSYIFHHAIEMVLMPPGGSMSEALLRLQYDSIQAQASHVTSKLMFCLEYYVHGATTEPWLSWNSLSRSGRSWTQGSAYFYFSGLGLKVWAPQSLTCEFQQVWNLLTLQNGVEEMHPWAPRQEWRLKACRL